MCMPLSVMCSKVHFSACLVISLPAAFHRRRAELAFPFLHVGFVDGKVRPLGEKGLAVITIHIRFFIHVTHVDVTEAVFFPYCLSLSENA